MTDNTRCEPAEGWPESRQFDIRPVTDADLDRWEEWARQHAHLLCLGALNWPMIVRSLIADRRAPAASPEVVRGLVEALDAMQAAVKSLPPSAVLRLSDDLVTRFLRADGRATAMLKAAKEAGL